MIGFLLILTNSITINISIPMNRMKEMKESFYDMLYDASDAILLFTKIDNIPRIDFINKAMTEQFGFGSKDMTNEPLWTLFTNKEDLEKINIESSFVTESIMKKANEESFISELSFHPFEILGMKENLMVSRDISEFKKRESQLDIFNTIFTNSNESMFITDDGGIIRWVNNAFLTIYGYTKHEVLGQHTRIFEIKYSQ